MQSGRTDAAVMSASVLRARKREELYRDLLMRFFVLMKTAQLTPHEDADYCEALEPFLASLQDCLDSEGSMVISERDGHLFLNAVRARVDADGFPAQRFLVQTLAASGFAGILFERGVTAGEVSAFLDVLCRPGEVTKSPMLAVDPEHDIRHIHPLPRTELPFGIDLQDEGDDLGMALARDVRRAPAFPRKTYFKSIFVLKHLLAGVDATCCLDLREAKQIAQAMVERILDDEETSIALELVREWHQSLFPRAINIAVLAVALGRRMGVPATQLGDLGVAALFHRIGESSRPDAEPGGDAQPASFRRLISKGGCSRMMLRAALVAWEHPPRVGAAGRRGEPSRLTRIVRVASRFHDLVGPRETGGGLTARAALERLRQDAASWLDPQIVSVLEAVIVEDSLG